MIGIIGNGRRDGKSSFATLIRYCRDREGVAHSGIQNIHFEESAAVEMESLAFENRRCKDPLMHIILSWRETELPSNAQVDEAVKIALKELDLQDCQAVREHLSRTDFGNGEIVFGSNIHSWLLPAVSTAAFIVYSCKIGMSGV